MDAPPPYVDRVAPELRARIEGRRVTATATDAHSGAQRLQVRVDGGRWRARSLEDVLFDGTQESLAGWEHAGAGSFELTADGTLRTSGGLGLLWYREREYGDATIRLQWREARPDGVRSNGGVFVRFPGPGTPAECDARLPLALTDFTWHAVACGHELQINDGDVDPQQTGSVYGFAPLDREAARPAAFGAWNDYEVRTVGGGAYEVTVVRNGRLLNRFTNTPGQAPVTGPPSSLYPGTEYKQFARGLVGLQNHGDDDVIEYRNVRALPLGSRTTSFRVRLRARVVRVRAVDLAGNRSRVVRLRLRPVR